MIAFSRAFKSVKRCVTLVRTLNTSTMANSRYEYVRKFETDERILHNVWFVIRIDGKGFHKFTKAHNFDKPNDEGGLHLMSHAAVTVMQEFNDIVLAYGQSDEYSFVFRRNATLYNRRSAKIVSNVNSLFASAYVFNWTKWMATPLTCAPSFDARIILYPTDENLRDYLSWRQADVHINNLYNTAFWSLVLTQNLSNTEAEAELRGTFSADKNELLFSKFNINYNNLPAMYRKGTTLLRKRLVCDNDERRPLVVVPLHVDMIRKQFWDDHPEVLAHKLPMGDWQSPNGEPLPKLVSVQLTDEQEDNKTQSIHL